MTTGTTAYRAAGAAAQSGRGSDLLTYPNDGSDTWVQQLSAADGNETLLDAGSGSSKRALRLTQFGFTSSDIPSDAIVSSIDIYTREEWTSTSVPTLVYTPVFDTGSSNTDRLGSGTAHQFDPATYSSLYYAATNVVPTVTITAAQVVDQAFGIDITSITADPNSTARFDVFQIRINWASGDGTTDPGTGTDPGDGGTTTPPDTGGGTTPPDTGNSGSTTTTVVEFIKNGTSSWIVPTGVTSIKVEMLGCGGNGGKATTGVSGSGGGSGAYSCVNTFAVTPGQTIACQVPTGGGQDFTWFYAQGTMCADYGRNGGQAANSGAVGGTAANSIGDITYSGSYGAISSAGAGGGAGSAGPAGPGNYGGYNSSSGIGGGGGGANGGSSSGGANGPNGGAGGNGNDGTGGGASVTKITGSAGSAGTNGGGGSGANQGGASTQVGGAGAMQAIWTSTITGEVAGPGGGGGGGTAAGASQGAIGGAGGNYGGGGGGGGKGSLQSIGGAGGAAIIVLTYQRTTSTTPAATNALCMILLIG